MIIDSGFPVTAFHLEFRNKLTVSSSDTTITERTEVLEDGQNVLNAEDYYYQ
ncbi:MAG TPA: hypothetical protein VFI70_05185 [Nitrososphaeraceae archaeon]|jgi:hypothetical protein|nr:hypothetical protein [Nitrososphaeraceae archaeon]